MSNRLPCPVTLATPAATTVVDATLEGCIRVPADGSVVLTVTSPRPLALRIGSATVLEADLNWRRYERQVRAIVVMPLAAGDHVLVAEVGQRPTWPASVDHDCPSRHRETVRQGLLQRRPDRVAITAEVEPGCAAVPCSIRVLPTQCRQEGVTWQHVLVRLLPGARALRPTVLHDRPGRLPLPRLALATAVPPCHARDVSGPAEREAGLVRFLVPVSGPEHPMPEARAQDTVEDRLEPECAVIGDLELVLDDATPPLRLGDWERSLASTTWPATDRRIAVRLPVHESQGRLAAVRERRELSWPDAGSLRTALPRPLVPQAHNQLLRIWDHAWDMLLRLRRHADPHSGLPNDYFGTASQGFNDFVFVWDSCFTTMAAAWGWRAYPAHANLDCLYSRQFDGGYIPRETDVNDGSPAAYEPDFSPNPPIQAIAEMKLACLTGDRTRLAAAYPVLCAQHRWLRANRRLPDGTFWTTGLASGLDNSPSLGDGYPCLTAQMAHEAEQLATMAHLLGRPDEAASWERERVAIGEAMNQHLWSDALGIYGTSLAGGGHNPNKVVTGFWPLWSGLVPAGRVERLARQLLDPATFWRHHPLPSLAADSPHFRPVGDYWLGSVWAPTTAATVWGFDRCGRHDLAVRTALRHLEVLAEVHAASGRLWENYCSERSERGSWSRPDYSWTAVGPIALLLEVIIGVQPDALANRIRWQVPEGAGWGIERIPFGQATVDLRTQPDGSLLVSTDRRFSLDVMRDGLRRTFDIPAGDHRLQLG